MARRSWSFAVSLLLLVGCFPAPSTPTTRPAAVAGPLLVATSFYPTSYFATRIGSDLIEVVCPLPEGQDPASWQPSDEALSIFQEADLVILNGAGFEGWAATASLPVGRVVNSSNVFSSRWLQKEGMTHSHGPEGVPSGEALDGHTWLDPELAILQAREIHQALLRKLPGDRALLAGNLLSLERDLMLLDEKLHSLPTSSENLSIIAAAPVYRYLAGNQSWKLISLDLDRQAPMVGASRLQVERAVQTASGRVLLWPRLPSAQMVEELRQAFGVHCVFFSPCAVDPGPQGDYISVMEANIEGLRFALEEGR